MAENSSPVQPFDRATFAKWKNWLVCSSVFVPFPSPSVECVPERKTSSIWHGKRRKGIARGLAAPHSGGNASWAVKCQSGLHKELTVPDHIPWTRHRSSMLSQSVQLCKWRNQAYGVLWFIRSHINSWVAELGLKSLQHHSLCSKPSPCTNYSRFGHLTDTTVTLKVFATNTFSCVLSSRKTEPIEDRFNR